MFQSDNGHEFKSDVTKLLEKDNVDIRRTTTKYKHTHTAFVEAFNKELAKLLFKPMGAQELQDPEKASTIWVKNVNSTVIKMNNTKSLMIDMKPKDAIKLDSVKLDKTYPKENVLIYGNVLCVFEKNQEDEMGQAGEHPYYMVRCQKRVLPTHKK